MKMGKRLLAATISATVTAGVQAQSGTALPRLEEMTVTAAKRSETLQEVPMSISAIGGESIERLGVANFDNIATTVPSLSLKSAGPGRTKLNIRGVSAATGVAPTVSFYLDEMPISTVSSGSSTSFAQAIISPKLFDLERVEVLRGPQGTLYGSSSMGGTVRLITRQPNLEQQEGKVNLEVSATEKGGNNATVNGMFNTPLGDNTALRVVGSYTDNDGYFDRVNSNSGAVFASKVNTEESQALRVALRHEFSPGSYVQPYVFYQKTEMDGKPNYDGPSGDKFSQNRIYDAPEPFEDEFTLVNLTGGHDFNFASLLISASQIERDFMNVEDITDPTVIIANDGINDYNDFLAQGNPGFADELVSLQDRTVEARLNSNSDSALSWIVGVYWKDAEANSGYRMQRGLSYKPAIAAGLANTQDLKKYEETALFGELTYEFTPSFELTLGVRQLEYDYSQFKEDWGWAFGSTSRAGANVLVVNLDDEETNGKITATFHVLEDSQLYATVATGSRPGGGNRTVPRSTNPVDTVGFACNNDLNALGISSNPDTYDGDSVLSKEIGWKAVLNDRVRFNVAVYQMDWKDIQQTVTTSSTCGVNFTANLGEAETEGIELEISTALTDTITLNAGFGYTKAELTESFPTLGIRSGDKLADVPEFTFSADIDYVIPASKGEYFVVASYQYVDETLEVPGQANSDVSALGITSGNVKPDYSIVNLRGGYNSEADWEAVLFVNNITDEEAIYSYTDALAFRVPQYDRTVRNQPRTVGLNVTYSF